MVDNRNLDDELRRLLESAEQTRVVPVQLTQLTQTHSSVWPWQVPQVPTHLSDRSPSG
jgi:hypothetical protein